MLGDQEPPLQIETLLERHLPDLRAYVRRNMDAALAQRESCADLVQSICREALQSKGQFEFRGEAAFRQWLLQMALHKLIDRRRFYRARKREGGQLEPVAGSGFDLDQLARLARTLGASPSSEASLREELAVLAAALDKLAEPDRAMIRMIHLEGLTHADVAERVGCSVPQSRGRLFLALARLSAHLRVARAR
jgi:RNA polymerase sigma-70 factor (ECF subfamily)